VSKEMMGGMDVQVYDAAIATVCDNCGVLRIDIPNVPGLISAVAVMRCATTERKLNGKEIRFVRKAMGKTAKELAALIDVTEETFSRWENDKLVISNPVERILRGRVCRELGSQTKVDWDYDDILYRLKLNPLADAPVLHLAVMRRNELWRERKAA
jgi:DNA-binding XRE family transcriptional regulator